MDFQWGGPDIKNQGNICTEVLIEIELNQEVEVHILYMHTLSSLFVKKIFFEFRFLSSDI